MAERKKQSLLTGAGVLAIATMIVKFIGLLYKIPLTNLITVEGYGYFTGAYAVYTPLYAISMAGLPVAVSKLVSQNVELGKIKDAQLIFKAARKLFFLVGLIGTVLLALIAVPYSKMVKAPENYISILAISPCILFCCMMSSFRGYYEGLKNMTPTGVSQVIEALIKLLFGLAGTYIWFNHCLGNYRNNAVNGVGSVLGVTVESEAEALSVMYPYAAAVAIFGVTLGSMFGFVYLVIKYKRNGFGFTREEIVNSPKPQSEQSIRKQIISFAIPVALSSLILNVSNIIDDITIRARLAHAVSVGGDTIKTLYEYSLTTSQTLDSGITNYLYGIHGSVVNIKNLIPTITLTLGISAIPAISTAWANRNKKQMRLNVQTIIRVCMIIAMPCGLGIAALSGPILNLLYHSQAEIVPIGAPLLRLYGFGIFLFAVASPITSVLQAIGRTDVPLKSICVGSAVKILLNFILIGTPMININGAPISTIVCYIIMLSMNVYALLRETKIKINLTSTFLKPLLAGLACGITAWGSYKILAGVLSIESRISCLFAICVGGVFYVAVLILVKGIAKDDLEMIPKGEKIAKVLAKFNLLG